MEIIPAALDLRLDRLGHLSGHPSRERAHLLRLSLERAELLAPIGCLQFHCLGKILSPRKALHKFEAGIDVPLCDDEQPCRLAVT